MFQFPAFASFRIIDLQSIGLPHSEIYGCSGCWHLTVAYRSLPRPSSPLRAKASTIRPYFAFIFFILYANYNYTYMPISSNFHRSISEISCNNMSMNFLIIPNRLSGIVENIRVELMTPCLQSKCSSQLS